MNEAQTTARMIATFGSETEGGDRADADAPLCARGISPNWNAEGKYEPNDIQPEPKEITRSAKCLVIDKPGLLDTLCWVDESVRSLAAHEVLVETRAVGLNFRDVMVAMEVLKFGNPNALGRELSGVVREVGSEVSSVQVGDRVCGLHADGCFSTRAIMLDSLVIRMPDGLGFQEAATMPACYTTAIQALVEVARLKSCQSILIHSACGGVGHAAVSISKVLGAEIFCTVGSEEKARYLVDVLEISRDHIFSSRNAGFVSDLMEVTDGRGADVVLNSLSGELLHASWRCVAEFGKLVELGKTDLIGHAQLDMEAFSSNRSYCGIDLVLAEQKRPELVAGWMSQWMQLYTEGAIKPIPAAIFPSMEIVSSFRYIQKRNHVGKAVVLVP